MRAPPPATPPTRRPPRPLGPSAALFLALVPALVLTSAGPAHGELERTDLLRSASVVYPCSPGTIEAGDALWVWAFGDGFYRASEGARGRVTRWTQRRAVLTIPLADARRRTVRLRALAGPEDQEVSALWNGEPLGTLPVPRRWSDLVWEVPARVQRPGTNRFELRASATRRPPTDFRSLALQIERVELEPTSCDGAPMLATDGRANVPPGGLLVAPVTVPPEARLRLDARGARGSSIEVRAPEPVETLSATRPGSEPHTVDLGECCLAARAVTLLPRGPRPVRLRALELEADPSQAAWRRACGALGLLPVEALAVAGLLVLLLFAGRAGEAGRARGGASPRRRVLLETGAVVAVAFAARATFLVLFPPGVEHGFPDTWGYLNGARRLLDGTVPFWGDVGWHNWFTWIRPPGYYLVLAGLLGPLGGTIETVAWIQAGLSAAAAGAISLAARALFARPERPGGGSGTGPSSGRGAALAAGLLFALDPESITAPVWIVTEPLFVALLCLGLAALARIGPRATWRPGWAAAAGAALGLATLVRSAPLYYTVAAAVLLLLAHRRREWLAPAAWLVGAMALVVLPWCVRNSLLFGFPAGVDDIALQNLLQSHPDPDLVPTEGVDLETDEGRLAYRRRVSMANTDQHLSRRSRQILLAGAVRLVRHPGRTWDHATEQLAMATEPFSVAHVGAIAGARPSCAMALWADLMTAVRYLTWALALVGIALEGRRRETWPVLLWLPFNLLAMILLFHVELRYLSTVVPVAVLFAGAACSRLGALARSRLGHGARRTRRPEATP